MRPGFDPAAIRAIVCRTAEGPVHRLWEPLAEKQRPTTPYGAKFSLPYCIALVLVEGQAGVDGFSDTMTRDPRILEVAEKVRYVLDPTMPYPQRFTGHVRVELGDGRVLEETQNAPRGGPEYPLTPEELYAKFRANAARALPAAQVATLLQQLVDIQRAADVAPTAATLRRGA
jgi:2-methylcitrate dehydratase PrpD